MGDQGIIGRWCFDERETQMNHITVKEDWLDSLKETTSFLKLAEKWFGKLHFNIKMDHTDMNGKYLMIRYRASNIDEISSIVLNHLEKTEIDFNFWKGFKIECLGRCTFSDIEYERAAYLFNLLINRKRGVSLNIETQNLCFVPYNHIIKAKQFEIWKNNAPKLAKLLHEFSSISKLKLILEEGKGGFECGSISKENIFYLVGKPFKIPEGEIWDDWAIPFELLNEEDHIFGQIGNEGR
jgi:hypothetical protein